MHKLTLCVVGLGIEAFLPSLAVPSLHLLSRFLYSSHCPGVRTNFLCLSSGSRSYFWTFPMFSQSPNHRGRNTRICAVGLFRSTEGVIYISFLLNKGEMLIIPMSACFKGSSLCPVYTCTNRAGHWRHMSMPANHDPIPPIPILGTVNYARIHFMQVSCGRGAGLPATEFCRGPWPCDRTTVDAHEEISNRLYTGNTTPFNLSQVHSWVPWASGMHPRSRS